MIKITQLLLCIAMLASAHAQAKVQTFEEIFTGTIVKTSAIDPDNVDPDIFNDPDSWIGQSTLVNGDVTLTLFYTLFDFSPSHYPGAGTFTRTDSMGAFSGNFNIYYSLPDYGSAEVTSSGFFDQDSQSSTLPNTGVYLYSWAFGDVAGTLNEQGDVNLRISWTIRTPDVFVPVPEPHSALMLCLGLLMLTFRRKQK